MRNGIRNAWIVQSRYDTRPKTKLVLITDVIMFNATETKKYNKPLLRADDLAYY